MDLFERIFQALGFKPKTEQEKFEDRIKLLEIKKAESQLRLARERDKPDPDPTKAGNYEKEVIQLQTAIDDEKKRFGVFDPDPLFNPMKIQENMKRAEECRANAQRKLEMEKSKLNPDFLKVDLYSREMKQWENLIRQLNDRNAKTDA